MLIIAANSSFRGGLVLTLIYYDLNHRNACLVVFIKPDLQLKKWRELKTIKAA